MTIASPKLLRFFNHRLLGFRGQTTLIEVLSLLSNNYIFHDRLAHCLSPESYAHARNEEA